MGAGILPTTIINNQLYFLFGKENKYEDTAPGFGDFGGGEKKNESFLNTAIREGCEELTGFLGSEKDLKKLLSKYGTYNIDCKTTSGSIYRLHLFPLEYDEKLAFYYNNNQKFLQKRLYPNVLKKSKIFEKEEIRWICVDDLLKMKKQFRFFYIPTLERLTREKEGIKVFIEKSLLGNRKYNSKKGTKRLRFQKNKTRRMKF
jgi:hypothetical protein